MKPCRAGVLRSLTLSCGLLLSAGLLPSWTSAQALTPADSAAVLFEVAREFDEDGRSEVAAALYELVSERFPETPSGARARAVLDAWRGTRSERSGRVELQVWSTLYGLWLGVAVPTALGATDSEAYGAGILLGAPAGFLVARAHTRSRELSEGQTRAITWGGTWGTWQGLGWASVLDLGQEQVCERDFCYETGDPTEARFASMIAGGLAGGLTGGWLSRRDIDAGVASGAHYGSLWGSWLGVAGGVLGDLENDDLMAATLLAGNAGLVGGAHLAGRHGLSRNRVRLISLGGLLGGLAGVGVDLLVQPDDEKVVIGIPLVLSGAGLTAATYMTRDEDVRSGGTGGGAGHALLRFDRDGWSADVPVPSPTLLRALDPNGREVWRPGLKIALLHGTF
ncbi:MAG: hypothetical protein U5R14_02430 [Gemmatimonadota bacterium]|nr:hypothetical protein [Gemmatimonadota bacterium]